MKLPIGDHGTTTVNELIAALLDFPPGGQVSIYCNNAQDIELQVDGVVVFEA